MKPLTFLMVVFSAAAVIYGVLQERPPVATFYAFVALFVAALLAAHEGFFSGSNGDKHSDHLLRLVAGMVAFVAFMSFVAMAVLTALFK